ncbi:hypothetical protein ACXZ7E_23295 [Paenibacillus lautus]
MSKKIQYLDYAVQDNVLIPLVYLTSEQFDQLIFEYDSFNLKQVRRRKKRGA